MVLDKLKSSLKSTLEKVAGTKFVDDTLINEISQDIQRALLQADADVELVYDLTEDIKERALEEETPSGITQKEHLINIVYEELTKFLGEESREITSGEETTKVMVEGLFGAGKTTTCGKMAKFYKKRGHKIALVQTDTWRPAAYEQLQQISEDIGVDFYGDNDADSPEEVWSQVEEKIEGYDLVFVDTAGRDALNDDLIEELNSLDDIVDADEKLLVIPADIGQTAKEQAKSFRDATGITGVVVTKLDGTAKGGGALSACATVDAPVVFVGIGEKLDDLERFKPENFVSRLLGMGDLETLLEKAEQAVSKEKAEDLGKRFMQGDFNLLDLYDQMEAMNQMGSLQKIVEMIPGFSKFDLPEDALEVQEERLELWKYAMDSMTEEELKNPDVLNNPRMERISEGSGVDIEDVRALRKQYNQAKKMTKMFEGRDMKKAMKQMGQGDMPDNFDPSMLQ